MLVLDYLKVARDATVIVPPFHTGHLGFIPGTDVYVGRIRDFKHASPSHCELVVSPFHQSAREMARISCTLKDGVGVVHRFISAISELDVNIVELESSSINRQDNHVVNLLVDMSTSPALDAEPRESKRSTIRLYSRFDSILPLHDFRYVRVFENILAHCADIIIWSHQFGHQLPLLRLSPLGHPELAQIERTTVRAVRDARSLEPTSSEPPPRSDAYHVAIDLPASTLGRVRHTLQRSQHEQLYYILLSDTDERNLRIFFPTLASVERIVHVGFYHQDAPGVMAAITDGVATSEFNILTGLVRNLTETESVWEVLLEYRGSDELPIRENLARTCSVVAELVSRHSAYIGVLRDAQVKVGAPLYPKRAGLPLDPVSLTPTQTLDEQQHQKRWNISEQIARTAAALRANSGDISESPSMKLLELVRRRTDRRHLPRIFLSYPRHAFPHAKLLKDHLGGKYELSEYQQGDGEVILDEVMRRITDSDYFIGIWHHDEMLPTGTGKYNISPWMPFEYGIAFAEDKPAIVVHSDKLDERIWKRINAGIANPEYSDLNFRADTLLKIEAYCDSHFR